MATYNSAQVIIREQDVSALAAEAFGHPYLILGETISGRDDVPVLVSNKANFVNMLGGSDTSMPGTYAAMEYLSFGNQLIFKRVTSTKFIKIQASVTATIKKTDTNYGNNSTVTLTFASGALSPYLVASSSQLPTVLFLKPTDGTAPIKVYIVRYLGTLPTNKQAFQIYWDSYGVDFDIDTRLALSSNDISCDVYISHAEKSFNSNVLFPKTSISPSIGDFVYDSTEKTNYSYGGGGLDNVSYYITSYANTSGFGSLQPVVAKAVDTGGSAAVSKFYAYRFSYVNGTIESAVSAPIVVESASSGTGSFNITFPPMISGYNSYNLYRAGGTGGSSTGTEAACISAGSYALVNTSSPIGLTEYTDVIATASGAIPTCPITIQLNGSNISTALTTDSRHYISVDSNDNVIGEYKLDVFTPGSFTWYKGSSPEPSVGDIFYKVIEITSSTDTYPNNGASLIGDGGITAMTTTAKYFSSGFIPLVNAPGPLTAALGTIDPPTACIATLASPATPGNVDDGTHIYVVTYVNASGETTIGTVSNTLTVADKSINGQVDLTAIPVGPAGTTARNIYRSKASTSSPFFLVTTIADNTTTTYTDNIADTSLTTSPPSTNTATDPNGLVTGIFNYKVTFVTTNGSETELGFASNTITTSSNTVALTDIPVAASGLGVVARNIYRSKSGPTGAWYYLGTISDNTTTTYLDDLPSSGLGLEGTNLVNTIYSRLLMYTGNSTYTLPNAIDYFKAYLTIINNNYYYYAPISFDRYAAVCKGRGLWSNGYSIYTAYNKTTREYECFIYNASGVLAERWTESTLSALVMKVNEYSAYISLEAMSDSSVTSGFVAYDLNVSGLIGSAQYYKATLHAGYDGFAKDVLGQSVDIGDFMANIDTGIAGAKYSLDPDFADLVSSAQQIEAFDGGLDYEVMLIPGYSDHPELASKMVNVCESRMYSCCLLDTPSGLSPNAAIQYRTQNLASVGSSYAALYWNYGKVYDPQNDIYVWLPPSVFAVRALAVTDNSATPWAAAAGLRRGLVPEILELEYYPALGDRENLQGVQINPIAKIGNTLAVWGNKTTQPFRSMLSNFNTRRMLISAEKAVYITSQSSLFEPNDKTERTRLMLSIQPVFDTIRQQRGLLAFLIADATTDADSAENIARFRIELQPTPTMEVIYYDVVIKNPAQALSSSSTF